MKKPLLLLIVAAIFPMVPIQAKPIAEINFASGESRNLSIVTNDGSTESVEGRTALALKPDPELAAQAEWDPEMPNPGVPGAGPSTEKGEKQPPPALVLSFDPAAAGLAPGSHTLAFLFSYFDITENSRANQRIAITWPDADSKTGIGTAFFDLSGTPFTDDPIYKARWNQRLVLAQDVEVSDPPQPIEFRIEAPTALFVDDISVYAAPDLGNRTPTGKRPAALSPHAYRTSDDPLDAWKQDMQDLAVLQTRFFVNRTILEDAARVFLRHSSEEKALNPIRRNILQTMESLQQQIVDSQLSMDEFFHEGPLQLVRGDYQAYRTALSNTLEPLLEVDRLNYKLETLTAEGIAKLNPVSVARAPAVAMGHRPPDPEERVMFTAFKHESEPYLEELGIDTLTPMSGAPLPDEEGRTTEHSREFYRKRHQKIFDGGKFMAPWVGHHDHYVTKRSWAPSWLVEKSGGHVWDVGWNGKDLKPRWDLWNPYAREFLLTAVENYARETAQLPNMRPWFTWTELSAGEGYSEYAAAAFKKYLKDHYGTIEVLNEDWGTSYADFEAIESPPPPGEELREEASPVAYYFQKFRRDTFTALWNDVRAALQRGNPDARLWLEGWGRFDYLPHHGMDHLALFDAADLAGSHVGSMGQQLQYGWQEALSRYSGTPISDGEINVFGVRYNGSTDQEGLRAAAEQHLLTQFFQGVRAFTFWDTQFKLWRNFSSGGPYLYRTSDTRGSRASPMASNVGTIGLIRRKMDHYDPILKGTRVLPPGVGILYSPSSMISGWPYDEVEHETNPIHSWLFQADTGYQFVHEDALVDQRETLENFRVLFVPWGMWLQPGAETALADWVKRGGILIASGPVGAYNQIGKPLANLLQEAFGPLDISYEANERLGETRLDDASIQFLRDLGDRNTTHFGGWAWNVVLKDPPTTVREVLNLADGKPVAFEAPLGEGQIIFTTGPIGKNALRKWALRQVERRVQPLVRVGKNDAFRVQPRVDAHGNLFLFVVNYDTQNRVEDTLVVNGRYPQVRENTLHGIFDLPSKVEESTTEIPLTLAPGEGTLLELGPLSPGIHLPKDRRLDLVTETGDSAALFEQITEAKMNIPDTKQTVQARAEARALLRAAHRHASLGYGGRARALIESAENLPADAVFDDPRVATVVAPFADRPPKLEGDLDVWRDVPRHPLPEGNDASAEFAIQWDNENLYVLLVVRDENIRMKEEQGQDFNWVWRFDGLKLVINAANTAPATMGGALHDVPFGAAQTVVNVSVSGRKYISSPAGFSPGGIRSVMTEVPEGYLLETAIPLKDLMLPPVEGANVGFRLALSNSSETLDFGPFSKREGYLANVVAFQRLVLGGASEHSDN